MATPYTVGTVWILIKGGKPCRTAENAPIKPHGTVQTDRLDTVGTPLIIVSYE